MLTAMERDHVHDDTSTGCQPEKSLPQILCDGSAHIELRGHIRIVPSNGRNRRDQARLVVFCRSASCVHFPQCGFARPQIPKNSRANLEQLFGRSGPRSRHSIFHKESGAVSARHSSTSTANGSLPRFASAQSYPKSCTEIRRRDLTAHASSPRRGGSFGL